MSAGWQDPSFAGLGMCLAAASRCRAAALRLSRSGSAFSCSMVRCIREWVSGTPGPSEITPCFWCLMFISACLPSSQHNSRRRAPPSRQSFGWPELAAPEFPWAPRAGLVPVSSKSTRNERQSQPDFPNCSTLSSSLAESAPE